MKTSSVRHVSFVLVAVLTTIALTDGASSSAWFGCYVYGEAHYRTFDGRFFDYQGVCKYLLVDVCRATTLPKFTIYARNEFRQQLCGSLVSLIRYVEIHYGGSVIRIDRQMSYYRATVTVDNLPVSIPYNSVGNTFSIRYEGRYVIYNGPSGLEVRFDGVYHLAVILKTDYRGLTCGLCGNYNGLASDDLTTAGGVVLSTSPDPGPQLGDSFQVPSDPEDATCPRSALLNPVFNPTLATGYWVAICNNLIDVSVTGVFYHFRQCDVEIITIMETIHTHCLMDGYFCNGLYYRYTIDFFMLIINIEFYRCLPYETCWCVDDDGDFVIVGRCHHYCHCHACVGYVWPCPSVRNLAIPICVLPEELYIERAQQCLGIVWN